ncbi:MAG TPA: hypothetical protein VGI96_40205 [Streptosporangiaceae bacterium]|jgi:hypothetical protein
MLFLIRHRYPRLGAILSVLSSVVFLALAVDRHSVLMIVSSALFLALPLVKSAYQRRATPPARS